MRFSKKTLILAASMILCMTMTAFGTVAYLTDRAAIANTFTVGNISITVDEARVDENGNPVDTTGKKDVDRDNNPDTPDVPMTEDEYNDWKDNNGLTGEKPYDELPDSKNRTETGNTYKLIPGKTYTKDPTMTIKAGSEESYVRMVVKINNAADLKSIFGKGFLPQNYVQGWDSAIWPCVSLSEDTENDTLVYVFNYHQAVPSAAVDTRLEELFKTISIPSDLTPEQLEKLSDLRIDIEGHAIQTAAFESEQAAWNAFDAQYAAAIP